MSRDVICSECGHDAGWHIMPGGSIWNCGAGYLEKCPCKLTAEEVQRGTDMPAEHDPVNHPSHYRSNPSGVECITVVEHMGFNVGNAIKYLWRAGEKGNEIEDLRKAAWYVQREIERLTKLQLPMAG